MNTLVFQVVFSTVSLLHNTLTIEIIFFLSYFIPWSIMSTGCTSKDKSSLSSTGRALNTCDGFETYFLNIDTWKTLCIWSNFGGNSKYYATGPILSRILNIPMYLGLSFSLFWNQITSFQGATSRNTMSSTSNFKSFHQIST